MSIAGRLWQYQRERFPLATHGLLVTAFALAALDVSAHLGGTAFPGAGTAIAAIVTATIAFLHLRIADEFKDREIDARHRPELPVPRGLVTLRELAWLALAGAVVQAMMVLAASPALLPYLALLWAWTALLREEFLAGAWLKARPLAYMAAHLTFMPVIAFVLAAFARVPAGAMPGPELVPFAALAYAAGAALELGRKVRPPEKERAGVETYSALFGRDRAALTWAAAMDLTALGAAWVGWQVDFFWPVVATMLATDGVAILAAIEYLRPDGRRRGLIEPASGVLVLAAFVILGPLPRWATGAA